MTRLGVAGDDAGETEGEEGEEGEEEEGGETAGGEESTESPKTCLMREWLLVISLIFGWTFPFKERKSDGDEPTRLPFSCVPRGRDDPNPGTV